MLIAAVLLTGFADWLTSDRLWFGPFYLLSISLGTWILGAKPGAAIGLTCFWMGLLANGASVYPYGGVALVWNVCARFFAVFGVVVLISAFRRSYDREAQSARTDRLTGALTRQGLLEQASAAARVNGTAVLAYLDLDGFKAVNDRYGHSAGDEILRQLAHRIAGHLRSGDLFARMGGDEFLVYMLTGTAKDAREALASLHSRLNTSFLQHGHHVGCSVGAIILDPRHAIDQAAIDAADRLMYLAKEDGGGLRFEVHGPLREMSSADAPLDAPDPTALRALIGQSSEVLTHAGVVRGDASVA